MKTEDQQKGRGMTGKVEKVADAIKNEGWYGQHFAPSGHLHLTDEDALVLARAAITASEEWWPIETAPRDGTWFLIARLSGDEPSFEVGRHSPLKWPEYVEVGDGLYRKETHVGYEWEGFNNFHRATHWAPLPPLPAGTRPEQSPGPDLDRVAQGTENAEDFSAQH